MENDTLTLAAIDARMEQIPTESKPLWTQCTDNPAEIQNSTSILLQSRHHKNIRLYSRCICRGFVMIWCLTFTCRQQAATLFLLISCASYLLRPLIIQENCDLTLDIILLLHWYGDTQVLFCVTFPGKSQ